MVKHKHNKPLGHVQRSCAHNKSAANVLAALGIMAIASASQQDHVIANALAAPQGPGRGLGDNQLMQLQEVTKDKAKSEDVDTTAPSYKDAIAKTLALMKKKKPSQGSQSLPQMSAYFPSPSDPEAQAMQAAPQNLEGAAARSLPLRASQRASQSGSQAVTASTADAQANKSAAGRKSRKGQIRKTQSKGQEPQYIKENSNYHALQAPHTIDSIKGINQAQKDIDTGNQPSEQASVGSSSALASSAALAQAQNTGPEKELQKSGPGEQRAEIPTQQLSDKATDEEVAAALSGAEVVTVHRGHGDERAASQPSLQQSGPSDQTQTQTLQQAPQDSIIPKANSTPKKQVPQSTADAEEKRQEREKKLFDNALSTRISMADLADMKPEEVQVPQSIPAPALEEEGESSYSLAARLSAADEAKKREQEQEKQAKQGNSVKKAITSGKEKAHPRKSQKSKEELAEKQQNTDNNNEANLPLEKSESKSDKAGVKMDLNEQRESKLPRNEKVETKSQIIVGNDAQNLEKADINEQLDDKQSQIMQLALVNAQSKDPSKADDLQNLLKGSNEAEIQAQLAQSLGQMKLGDLKALQASAGLDPDVPQQGPKSLAQASQSVVSEQNEPVAPQTVLAPQAAEAPQAAAAPQAIESTPAPIAMYESKSDQQLAIEHTIALIRAKALNQKLEAESKAQNLEQMSPPKLEATPAPPVILAPQVTQQTQSSPKLSQDQLKSIVQAAVQKNARKLRQANQAAQPQVQAQQIGIQVMQVQSQIKTNESRSHSKQIPQQLEQTASEANIRQEPSEQLQQVPSAISYQASAIRQPIQPSSAILAPRQSDQASTAPNTQSAQYPSKSKVDTEKLKLLIKRISAQKYAQQADESAKQAQMNPDVAKLQVQTDGMQIIPDENPINQHGQQQSLSTKDVQTQMHAFLSQSNQKHVNLQQQSKSISGGNSQHKVIKLQQQHSKSKGLEKHAKTAVNKKSEKNKKSEAKSKNQKVISLKQIDTKKEAQVLEAKTVARTQNSQLPDGTPSKSPEEEYARKTAHLLNRADEDLTMSDQDLELDDRITAKSGARQNAKNSLKTAIRQNKQKKEENKTKKQIISLKAKDVRNAQQDAKMPQVAGGRTQPGGRLIGAQRSRGLAKQQVSQKQIIAKSPEEFASETQQQRREIHLSDNSGANLQRGGLDAGAPARSRSAGGPCADSGGCPIGSQGANWPWQQQVSQSTPQETKKAFENKEAISEQKNPSISQQDEILQPNQLAQPRAMPQQKEEAAETTLVGQQNEMGTQKLHQLNTQASSYKDLIAKTIALAKKQQPVASLAETNKQKKQTAQLTSNQAGKVIVKQQKNSFRRGPPASRFYLQMNEKHKLQQKGKFIQDWDEEKQEFTDTDEVKAEGDLVLHTVTHMRDSDHVDLSFDQSRWLNKQEPRIGGAGDAKAELKKHTDTSDSKGAKPTNQANGEKSGKLTDEAPVKAQTLPQAKAKDDTEGAQQHSTSEQKPNQETKALSSAEKAPSSKDIPDVKAQQSNMNAYLDSVNDNDEERTKDFFDHKDHDHKDQFEDAGDMAEKTAADANSWSVAVTDPHPDAKEPEGAESNSKDSTKDTDSADDTAGASIEELVKARVELLRKEGADREKQMKVEYEHLQNEKKHLRQEVDHAIAVKQAEKDIRAEKDKRQAAKAGAAARSQSNDEDLRVETDIIRDALRGLDDEDETSVEKYKEKRALPRPEEKNVNKKPTESAPGSEPVKETKGNEASPEANTQHTLTDQSTKMDHLKDNSQKEEVKEKKSDSAKANTSAGATESQQDQANKNKEQQAEQNQKSKDLQKDGHSKETTTQAANVDKQAAIAGQHLQDQKPQKEDEKPKLKALASSSQSANKNGATQKEADKSKPAPENKNQNTPKAEQAGKKLNGQEREQRSEHIHQQVQERLKEDHKTGIIFSIQNGIQNMFANAWGGVKWIFAHF